MRAVLGVLVVLTLAAVATPVLAGDYADREILGFSPKGDVFAFEEYGIEDGSGFPYSNIYLIYTDSDEWIAGTPIRIRKESEDATVDQARAEAKDSAQSLLDQRKIASGWSLVASNPVTEISADPHIVRFVTQPNTATGDSGWTVALTEKTLPAAGCPDMGDPFQGFTLALTDSDGNATTLHDDSRLPSSRKCPLRYSISDVVTFNPDGAEPVLVVLVNVFSVGFEGPDRRFLAVPSRFGD